jgi:hypothetical protein
MRLDYSPRLSGVLPILSVLDIYQNSGQNNSEGKEPTSDRAPGMNRGSERVKRRSPDISRERRGRGTRRG